MKQDELRYVMATKAPLYKRLLIEIPKTDIGLHHSSITDYLDKVVDYDTSMMRKIDELISRFHLGAVAQRSIGIMVLYCLVSMKEEMLLGAK